MMSGSVVADLLRTLIQIPSVSPMGRPIPEKSELIGEFRLTEYLCKWAEQRGLAAVRQSVMDGRENVVIVLPGDYPDVVLWEVHQDTVPTDQMTVPPFGGEVREGRVYGRGACDVKGTMACMLSALLRLKELEPSTRSTVLLACTIDEEQGGAGAVVLPELWKQKQVPTPRFAIVAEPTELDVVVAHKGVVRWVCETRGRAVHSSAPSEGESAIYRMSEVALALREYHDELQQRASHPLLGRASLNVGTIRGGAGVNLVPDHCEIEIDRRLLPDETAEEAVEDVERWLTARGLGEPHVQHHPPYLISTGLSDRDNSVVAERVRRAARSVGAKGEWIGVPFGTDASRLSPHLPCVVFGAGSIAQAHTRDEWVAISQLDRCTEALCAIATPESPTAL